MYRGLYKPKSPNGTPNTYMIGDTVLHEGKMYVALNQTQKSPLQSPRDWKFTNITEPYQNDDSPLSPEENQFWVDEGKNLYIRSFENGQFVWTLLSGSTLACWGSFWDTGNKGITSITAPYGITFGNSDPLNNGVSLTGGSRIVFSQTGVYNLQFSAQLMNTNNTNEQEATFWFRKNGADIPDSAGIGTISKQRGVDPGYSIIAYNLILPLVKDDFIEMYWHASSTDVTLHAYPAGASPVHPVAPSIIFTAHQLMRGAGSASIGGGGPYVISFNGLTGAVTGVTTGVANTFIPLQTFAAGISAAGATFNKPVTIKGQTAGGIFYVDALQGFVIEGLAGTPYIQLFKTAGNYIYLSDNDLYLQNTNKTVFIGDGDNQANSTNINVNDDQGTINMYANMGAVWDWDNSSGRITISSDRITLNGRSIFPSGISSAGATLSSNTTIPSGSTLTVAGTIISDSGYRISSSAINTQTGTTYTFLASDNGKIVTFNNGSTITATIPTALPVGFNCTAIQLGAGQVGFTAASGVTLQSYLNQFKIIGQHGSATLTEYATNIVNISGNLTT